MANVPYIFPQATNNQSSQPWWLGGMQGTTPVSGGVRKRKNRNVFYDPAVGPNNDAAVINSVMQPRSPRAVNDPSGWMSQSQPASSGASNDVAVIDAIMKPRSKIAVNDPSGWLNGGASREFQAFFNGGRTQEENNAKRLRELNASSLASMNPAAGRQVVDVARQNQEALNMIFPKAPGMTQEQAISTPTSLTDVTRLPGGFTQRSIDGRYGRGSATFKPKVSVPSVNPQEENTAMEVFGPPKPEDQVMGPPKPVSNEFVGPPNLGEFQGPPNMGEAYAPPDWIEMAGPPSQEVSGPPDWGNQSEWEYRQMPQETAQQIADVGGRGQDAVSRALQVLNPFMIFSTLKQGGTSQLPEVFGPQPQYPNANDRLAGDYAQIEKATKLGLIQGRKGKDKFGNDQNQVWQAFFKGNPVPFTR